MSKQNDEQNNEARLDSAYGRMLERTSAGADQAGEGAGPRLQEIIDEAREKAVELGELTREEAEKIGDYLRRDLHDAASFVSDTGKGLHDWLSFDLGLIEDRLRGLFSHMVDHTREELDLLAKRAWAAEHLQTGEVTGLGTLKCDECGQTMRFKKPGHLPPCPKCRGTTFTRVSG